MKTCTTEEARIRLKAASIRHFQTAATARPHSGRTGCHIRQNRIRGFASARYSFESGVDTPLSNCSNGTSAQRTYRLRIRQNRIRGFASARYSFESGVDTPLSNCSTARPHSGRTGCAFGKTASAVLPQRGIKMSRISKAFDHGKAFIAFITCGDPDLETTGKIVRAAAKNGADLIELGIPFSDPTAEGPIIQGANLKALNGGVTTDKILAFTKALRNDPVDPVTIPMVYMTYANVLFAYGYDGPEQGEPGCDDPNRDMKYVGSEKFIARAADAGIDGFIIPDVPYEEKDEFDPLCKKYGLDLVSMIAPTSDDRIAKVAKEASGFIYVVSSLGVTGERSKITTDIGAITAKIRAVTDVPCAVGFGINTPEQAAAMAKVSDGAIVGSAIIKIIDKYGKDAASPVGEYVKSMKDAIRDL